MNLPEIGETITTDHALELCRHFGLTYLVDRITADPDGYNSWQFDGASMVPDELFGWIFGIPNLIEIALRHDLKYAYGKPKDDQEKLRADLELELEVLNDGAAAFVAKAIFEMVDVGGLEKYKTNFSWAFARKGTEPWMINLQ